jgi:hypothetical protein
MRINNGFADLKCHGEPLVLLGIEAQFYQRTRKEKTPNKWPEIGVNKGFEDMR